MKSYFLRMSNEVDQQPTQMICQLMGHEASSAIQKHNVDFGQSLSNVCPNIQGGADFSFFIPVSRMLKVKSSSLNLLSMNVYSLIKL